VITAAEQRRLQFRKLERRYMLHRQPLSFSALGSETDTATFAGQRSRSAPRRAGGTVTASDLTNHACTANTCTANVNDSMQITATPTRLPLRQLAGVTCTGGRHQPVRIHSHREHVRVGDLRATTVTISAPVLAAP